MADEKKSTAKRSVSKPASKEERANPAADTDAGDNDGKVTSPPADAGPSAEETQEGVEAGLNEHQPGDEGTTSDEVESDYRRPDGTRKGVLVDEDDPSFNAKDQTGNTTVR